MQNALTPAAKALHRATVICDLTLPWTDYGRSDLRAQALPRMRASGVGFVSLTLASDVESQAEVVKTIGHVRREIALEPERLQLIDDVDDILAARHADRLTLSFDLQGTNALAGNLDMVELFYRLGVRHMLLAYNKKNFVADGCHERTDCVLSIFGVELVGEMNRVGMMVDCSHTGYRNSTEAMEVSNQPVIFSHSNPRALWDHERNICDEQAKACAATGGLVGVGIFTRNDDFSTDMLLRQIHYYSDLIRVEHVGLGLDYVYDSRAMHQYMAGLKSPPGGNYEKMTAFFQPEQPPALTNGLLSGGYAEGAVRGILGENFRRIARNVWR